ncbi:branched-chain-amino-acid aminotransferase-like protein 1 [Gigaspora margarita]|uniref:Branched-chain-amino-acid aminotransferase-like protein 1 n=1 Tax=Gigaspora margarita TaxID=4874 RepID=A0A8H4A289_GIGMA|nr:branched-chain-amino-acid aminotransferase-like protein 1 [Gigaspora margarita]
MSANQRPIILWSHPRSLSTVFERLFLKYPQEFHVIHEPLNQIGRAYVTKNFEFLKQIPLSKSTDPITFVHHFSPALNNILSLHYCNNNKTHTLRVFVKDHASNFLEAFEENLEGNPLGSKEVLSKFRHMFIIRNPEKSVKSFYKAAFSTCKAWEACVPNSEKYDIFFPEKVWLKDSRILYDLIKKITEEKIVLVDTDDLVLEPEKILRKYCEMVNIKFKKEMLEWKKEMLKIWDLKLSGPDIDYLWHKYVLGRSKLILYLIPFEFLQPIKLQYLLNKESNWSGLIFSFNFFIF